MPVFRPFSCSRLAALCGVGFVIAAAPVALRAQEAQQAQPPKAQPQGIQPQATTPQAGQQQQTQQVAVPFVPSLRFDLIAGSVTAGHVGISARTPFSNYFSLGGTVAAGISETGFSGRGDLFARVSLDPYHYVPWEPYVGIGGTARLDSGGPGTRSYLLAFVGLDGPAIGSIAPGIEAGLGGGFRFGVTLRWGPGAQRTSR